ncbi:hypothetical protein ACFYTF_11405 [Nocardia thailandica]|uniref:Uncharacterized protein n=1 Tax=Nocardia thailandica TaxID=257275 RepID=A0ABW6PLY1_9NOCA
MTAQPRANGGPALPRRAVLGLGAAALLGGAFVGCGADGGDSETTDDPDPQEIAVRAFVFGYPLVLHDATRSMGSTINTLDHSVLPGPLDRARSGSTPTCSPPRASSTSAASRWCSRCPRWNRGGSGCSR